MDKGKKKYSLRDKTFEIKANDRLKFMVDCRELYNQVAKECFGEVRIAATNPLASDRGQIGIGPAVEFYRGDKKAGWIPFTSMEKLLKDAREFGKGERG